MVAEGKDRSCAAIASAACTDVYGLEVKAAAIQNNDKNKTRFYVLSTEKPKARRSDRIAFIVKGKAELLPALMSDMEAQGMTLVAIHDRSIFQRISKKRAENTISTVAEVQKRNWNQTIK